LEPDSEDFKKVDAAFEKNVEELRAAGAILVDPISISNLNTLLAKRVGISIVADEALRLK